MRQRAIIDTGPLVSLLKGDDRYHSWSFSNTDKAPAPLLTCEPVIVEACFLLRGVYGGANSVMSLLVDGSIQIGFSVSDYTTELKRLMSKYESVPMSLADACLVKMAELEPNSVVITLDSDFRIYRMNRNEMIPVLMPEL